VAAPVNASVRIPATPRAAGWRNVVYGNWNIADPLKMNDNHGKRGTAMATADQPTLYDDLLDLLAETADVDRLVSYRLPDDKQLRLEELLQKSKDGLLTADERGELDEYERFEHIGRMLKARLRRKRSP
jgi:hypothetical protein